MIIEDIKEESFLKKHADTFAILATILTVTYMMIARTDDKFDKMEQKFEIRFAAIDARFAAIDARFAAIDTRMNAIENRLTAIETVMLCNKMMPLPLGKNDVD